MSANELILNSPLYRLNSQERSELRAAQQRPFLRDIVTKLTFSEQDLNDIAALEARKAKKTPAIQKLKFTGAETVALKQIEAARAMELTPNVSSPGFAQKGSAAFLGATPEAIRRSEQNIANAEYRQQRKMAEASLKINPAIVDTSRLAIHGNISPETLITLRRYGLV